MHAPPRKLAGEYVGTVKSLMPRAAGARLVVCGRNVLPGALVQTALAGRKDSVFSDVSLPVTR